MNKEESLTLYQKGHKAWNAWAEEMLIQRESLIETGEWMPGLFLEGRLRGMNAATEDWYVTARSDFSAQNFENEADFSGFVFPGDVEFAEALFGNKAQFWRATFGGDVGFQKATFREDAGFQGTKFRRDAMFRGAKFRGDSDFEGATFDGKAGFKEAKFRGDATFKSATFIRDAEFREVKFSGEAEFWEAKFGGGARFVKVTFSGGANFRGATFSGAAEFSEATFGGEAGFNLTSFKADALFYRARFISDARFDKAKFIVAPEYYGRAGLNLALFEGYTSFREAIFEYTSTFVAVKGQSFFTLKDVQFLSVPDFEQANFAEAPRLDHTYFEALGDEPDIGARWRALRRLAIQAHDHQREVDFLANEIKGMRGAEDKLLPNPINLFKGEKIWPGGGRYWAGLFYECFSNFGRSMLRPFLLWVIITTGSAFYFHYLSNKSLSIACCSGSDPVTAALYLSISNALVISISGLSRSEKLAQSYACLYGENGRVPTMPDAVVFAGIAQTLLSAILIFLFLLALRNYFRIK